VARLEELTAAALDAIASLGARGALLRELAVYSAQRSH
jgi:farnesyl diphosphate synthase